MADDATRAVALERLLKRKEADHKKELDRLHSRIRELQSKVTNLSHELSDARSDLGMQRGFRSL